MSNKKHLPADAVCSALSQARMSTYTNALDNRGSRYEDALELYSWNSEVSAALLTPLHLCEVVIRNAVADALEHTYEERWPWLQGFIQSLPDPTRTYSPRRDLQNATRSARTTGKVIPELNFVFWQNMFTSRHDNRIWNKQLHSVLPNLDKQIPISDSRESIYNDLQQIRMLRNRIAHHEPIFKRALHDDYSKIITLIRYRCPITAEWLDNNQQVTAVLASNPILAALKG